MTAWENPDKMTGAEDIADQVRRGMIPRPDSVAEALAAERNEIEALRDVLRKVSGSVSLWAALSYVDGSRACAAQSRWTDEEQALLRRAGL